MKNTTKEILLMLVTAVCFIIGSFVLVDIEFMDSLANMLNVFAGLTWFLGLFLTASLFTAYLVIVAKIKFIIRFLAIPLWLVFTLSTLITIDKFLGYAYPMIPPKSQLITYRIFLESESNTKMIESWMYLREGGTRLYKYEWKKEHEDELKKGRKANEAGTPIEIDLHGEIPNDRPIGKQQGSHINHGILHRGLPPKAEDDSDR